MGKKMEKEKNMMIKNNLYMSLNINVEKNGVDEVFLILIRWK